MFPSRRNTKSQTFFNKRDFPGNDDYLWQAPGKSVLLETSPQKKDTFERTNNLDLRRSSQSTI